MLLYHSDKLYNLFSAGQKWRDLRVKLSPTFTSGKLKGMLPNILNSGHVLDEFLTKNLQQGVDVFEFRDLMARFNTNIISSVAFGIDNDCINEPNHIFRRIGAKIFETTLLNGFKFLIAFLLPSIFHKIKLKIVDPEVENFIFSIVKQTIEHREQKNLSRNDFMQLMIQLKNDGFVSVDQNEKPDVEIAQTSLKKLTIDQLAANTFIFFVAGKSKSIKSIV